MNLSTLSRKAVIPIAGGASARLRLNHAEPTLCRSLSGTALGVRSVPGFCVIENRYASRLELPWHFHENAYLVHVLEGVYTESYSGSPTVTSRAGALRYLPRGFKHANVFESGSRCLIVEVHAEALARIQNEARALEQPGDIQGIGSTWLAQRLYREFLQDDPLAIMSLEGILLEILAEAARHTGAPGPVRAIPRWLRVARDYLESNFLRQLSLSEVAAVAGIHRVHLSREFRRHFSTTVGEFLRRKRIEHACRLVSATNEPLADVAMTCGFSDQSHFSATFRRQIGLTPGRFRQMAQSR